jgi:hypothetical protein
MAEGHARDQPLAAPAAAVGRRHIGLGPGFIDKDQVAGIERQSLFQPGHPPRLDIGTV